MQGLSGPSRLIRIESSAFSKSLLKSIEIPRHVRFIDGSAFAGIESNSISIEAGHEQFSIENDFLVDIINHRLIRNFSSSSNIIISSDIEILGSSCFSSCESLSSISFESNSRLIRIESSAFSYSSLESISIPRNVEIFGSSCFSSCRSLSSISFESNSRLLRIESHSFPYSSLESIEIPQNVEILSSSWSNHIMRAGFITSFHPFNTCILHFLTVVFFALRRELRLALSSRISYQHNSRPEEIHHPHQYHQPLTSDKIPPPSHLPPF
jgi:hypothetical protein